LFSAKYCASTYGLLWWTGFSLVSSLTTVNWSNVQQQYLTSKKAFTLKNEPWKKGQMSHQNPRTSRELDKTQSRPPQVFHEQKQCVPMTKISADLVANVFKQENSAPTSHKVP
jgi:hypothetical protein